MKQLLAMILILATMAACAATGDGFHPTPVAKDSAQLVIYKAPRSFAMPRTPTLNINGVDKCDLPDNSYVTTNVPSGTIIISSTLADAFGTSKFQLNAAKGTQYFIRMDYNMDKQVGNSFGLLGALLADTASSTSGPFLIMEVTKEAAIKEMSQNSKAPCE